MNSSTGTQAASSAPLPVPAPAKSRRLSLKRVVRALVIGIALVYTSLCGFLWFDQAHFIFFPSGPEYLTPVGFKVSFQDIWVPVPFSSQENLASSGNSSPERLHGWWLPNPSSNRVLLYLHGNGGNIASNLEHAVRLRNFGASVLIVDYRGYGRSTGGFPSESRVYEDAEVAWQYLVQQKKIKPEEIIIYGHSLGGAIAIELASHHPEAGGLIAESTFTSIEDMSKKQHVYSFFPIHLLLSQKFASLSKIPAVKMPALFIHGTGDELAPYHMSERLYEAAVGPKKLVLIEDAGHEDCAIVGGEKYKNAVQAFLKNQN